MSNTYGYCSFLAATAGFSIDVFTDSGMLVEMLDPTPIGCCCVAGCCCRTTAPAAATAAAAAAVEEEEEEEDAGILCE